VYEKVEFLIGLFKWCIMALAFLNGAIYMALAFLHGLGLGLFTWPWPF